LLTACGYRSGNRGSRNSYREKLTKLPSQPGGFSLIFAVRADPLRVWLSFQHSLAPLTIERLHEEFKRESKPKPCAVGRHPPAMMFWALLASGTDQHAQGSMLANPRHKTHRSAN